MHKIVHIIGFFVKILDSVHILQSQSRKARQHQATGKEKSTHQSAILSWCSSLRPYLITAINSGMLVLDAQFFFVLFLHNVFSESELL